MCTRKVAYFYHNEFGNINYGFTHPMKPKRIQLTHDLIVGYGLYKRMDVYKSHKATREEMNNFHSTDYLKCLQVKDLSTHSFDITNYDYISNEEIQKILQNEQAFENFKIGTQFDCPVFEGLYNFCQISAGGSIDSAILILNNEANICINWAGGLHHAKKSKSSGFCYINDIVLSILVLLNYFQRILYVDIDVHHGDGVEEAFYTTDRVMTVSFHQFEKDFFPGSGGINNIGEGKGKNYSINVPIQAGIKKDQYVPLFTDIMSQVILIYQPNAIILQCGADSLAQDKLGKFNLSTYAHGDCVNFILKQGIPTILLGGGGYTIQNVARCWAYETSIALNEKLENQIPLIVKEQNSQFFQQDAKLHIEEVCRNINQNNEYFNKNTAEGLQIIKEQIFNQLKQLTSQPGIQFKVQPNLNISEKQIQKISINDIEDESNNEYFQL